MSDDFVYKLVMGLLVFGALLLLSMLFWLKWAEEMEPKPMPDELLPTTEGQFVPINAKG